MTRDDYYETLGVPPSSSPEDIAQSFHRLARQYHPDLHPQDAGAASRFKEINAAYQTLSDPEKRARYDMERAYDRRAPVGAEAAPTMDIPPTGHEQEYVFHHSVTLHGEEIESALEDLRANLAGAANEVADELRGVMSDFARDIDAIARSAENKSRYGAPRRGFPPSPPQRRSPSRPKRR